MGRWIKDLWGYECRAHRKTLEILSTFIPLTRRSTYFAILAIVFVCIALAYFSGWEAVMDRLIEVGGVLFLLMLFYVFIRLLATVALEKENEQKIIDLKNNHKEQTSNLEDKIKNQVNQYENEILELKQKIAKYEERKPLPLEIEFDEENKDFFYESNPIGEGIYRGPLLIPRIKLYNTSQKAIQDFEVKLVNIIDKKTNITPKEARGRLSISLPLSNSEKSRTLNAGQRQPVDVFTFHHTFINHNLDIGDGGEKISLSGRNEYKIEI